MDWVTFKAIFDMPLVNFSKKNLVTLGETGINIDVEP
jgi:hypothetical protein